MPDTPVFQSFASIPRLFRECVVTEKIDGTNAQIHITEDGRMFVGSRTRWIEPGKDTDNFGFAAWCHANKDALMALGPGSHFGEWYGRGVQRGYGLQDRRFALFNTKRWSFNERPACCEVVPILYEGVFSEGVIQQAIERLRTTGSVAVPGYNQPEGVVVYLKSSGSLYKYTLDGDGHKGQR